MSYITLLEKLKRLNKKAKIKEKEVPKEILKEVCSYSPLYLFFDYDSYDKERELMYVYDNVTKVSLIPPFEHDPDDDEFIIRLRLQFINKDEQVIYGTLSDLYRTKELDKLWEEQIFPELKEGDLVQTISHSTFLIKDFSGLVISGFDDAEWDEIVPEGTLLTVLDKIKIDDFYMVRVFHGKGVYWSIGYLIKDKYLVDFNPHYI